MTNPLLNQLLFAVFPYVALFTFFLGTIMRYRKAPFTYSSLSSQFLENRQHFWGLVSFHYGILVILLGHLIGMLVPSHVLAWNRHPLRLYILEISALVFGLMTVIGLLGIIERRMTNSKARIVTSPMDWVALALLLFQGATGIFIAVFYPWGTSWYAASASPYLVSIFKFQPDISFLTTMPLLVKLHIINAWALVLVTTFTRLVHILVAPLPYLWRKPEVVRWYGKPGDVPAPMRNVPTPTARAKAAGA
jgi:nitrate reductase gamma subunit